MTTPTVERIWRADAWRGTRAAQSTVTPPTFWRGLDATAYVPEDTWFDDRFAEGFRLYSLHTTDWGAATPWWRTRAQLRAALNAGFRIGAYTRDPQFWEAGIQACAEFIPRLQFFALDVEDEGPFGDPGHPVTRAMVDGVKAMGVRPVIYSGSGMWPHIMGTSTDFADVPLWDTDTSSPPSWPAWTANLNSPTPTPYGGWNVAGNPRVIIQQAFNVTIGGITVDLNSVDPRFLEDK